MNHKLFKTKAAVKLLEDTYISLKTGNKPISTEYLDQGYEEIKKVSTYVSKVFKPGDWVRCLKNEVGATSQYNTGFSLMPYEAIQVAKFEPRHSSGCSAITFIVGRNFAYIPASDCEKLEDCICAKALQSTIGCKCGWATMQAAIAKTKKIGD